MIIQKEMKHFIVQIYKEELDQPVLYLDNRGFEPTQALTRIAELLDCSTDPQEGSIQLEIWMEQIPAQLFTELEKLGLSYSVFEQTEDVVRIRIVKP